MAYLISYLKDNATYHLEWIAPENWSTTAICRAFYERFPQAEIIAITPRGEGCLFG
jgi:putative exporter of polyketide antibiotics